MLLLLGPSFAVQVWRTGGPHGFSGAADSGVMADLVLLFHLEHEKEGRNSCHPESQARQRRGAEPAAPSSGGQELYPHPSLWRAAVHGGLSGPASSCFWFR